MAHRLSGSKLKLAASESRLIGFSARLAGFSARLAGFMARLAGFSAWLNGSPDRLTGLYQFGSAGGVVVSFRPPTQGVGGSIPVSASSAAYSAGLQL